MIDLHTAIKAVLVAADDVQAALAGGKIWSYWPRTYVTPCIVIEVDKDNEQNQLTGSTASGMLVSDVTITCRAGDPAGGPAAWTLWAAVRAALHGQTIADIEYLLEDTADASTPKAEGSTDHWYDRIMSFNVIRREPVA